MALVAIFKLPPLYFALFTAAVLAVGAWEWGPFIGFNNKRRRAFLVGLLLASMAAFAWFGGLVTTGQLDRYTDIVSQVIWASLIWWALALMLVISYPRSAILWRSSRWLKGFFGLATLLPAWLAINLLRGYEYHSDPVHGAWLLLYVMSLVWAADIGAYFAGKAFGRTKLMPNVSPGKTIEGMGGGILASSALIFLVLQTPLFIGHNGLMIVLISLSVVISSVFGDLLESMLKRQAGVKDSGTILPGHGGVLDRVDSLTAALPIFSCLFLYAI